MHRKFPQNQPNYQDIVMNLNLKSWAQSVRYDKILKF